MNFDSNQHTEKLNNSQHAPNLRNKEDLEMDSVFEFSNNTIGQYTSTQQTNISNDVFVRPISGTIKKKITSNPSFSKTDSNDLFSVLSQFDHVKCMCDFNVDLLKYNYGSALRLNEFLVRTSLKQVLLSPTKLP